MDKERLNFLEANKELKISIETNKEILKSWNYDEPCISIHNSVTYSIIPCSKVSFSVIEREIKMLSKKTEEILKIFKFNS